MQIRPYQQRAVDMLTDEPSVLVMPTGAGKTHVAQHLLRDGGLITCHLRTLVSQTARRLGGGVLMGSQSPGSNPIIVASIATLQRRTLPDVPILIVDEVHRSASRGYREVIAEYLRRGTRVLGLTATPQRLDGQGLGDVGFTQLVNPVTYEELFDEGVLVKPRLFEPHRPNMKGVHTLAGEYDADEASARVLLGHVSDHWKLHGDGRRGMAFACNVAHSRAIVDALVAVGARAIHLDANSPEHEREDALGALRDRRLDVISNCMLFGEGLDVPEMDLLFLCRPTKSIALYRQQAGRVMRTAPDKLDALIFDHAGNIDRHGEPWAPVPWTLDGKAKADRVPTKTCPKCFRVVHASVHVCECGFSWARNVQPALPIEHTSEMLVERVKPSADPMYWDVIKLAREMVPGDTRVTAFASMVLKSHRNGYKPGWAVNAWTRMFRSTGLPMGYAELRRAILSTLSSPTPSSASQNSVPALGGSKPVESASSTPATASEPARPGSA